MLKEVIFREQPVAITGKLCKKVMATVGGMDQPLFIEMLENLPAVMIIA